MNKPGLSVWPLQVLCWCTAREVSPADLNVLAYARMDWLRPLPAGRPRKEKARDVKEGLAGKGKHGQGRNR